MRHLVGTLWFAAGVIFMTMLIAVGSR